MSLLRSEKDNFDIEVLYVFDKQGQMNIIDEDLDLDNIKKTKEDKEKMDASDRLSCATDIPFNQAVDLLDYSEKDIKKAVFTFRRPSFDDMPVLLSSLMSANSNGEISPGNVFEFSDRKLKLLFVKGIAKEEDDSEIKITSQNLGKIPPVLGSAMSVKMTKILNM